jgi:hypothetical protein
MVLHAVRAESPFEEADNAAMLKLMSLRLKQIVRESEEPEACIAQLAQRRRNLGVWWHRGKLIRKLFLVLLIDLDAACIRQHFHHCRADIGERDVAAEYMMKMANHRRMALFSPKMRWKVGSIVARSRSVSLTSKTIKRRAAYYWTPVCCAWSGVRQLVNVSS